MMKLCKCILILSLMLLMTSCGFESNETASTKDPILFFKDDSGHSQKITYLDNVFLRNGKLIIPLSEEDAIRYKSFAQSNHEKLYYAYLHDQLLAESVIVYYETDYLALSLNLKPEHKEEVLTLLKSLNVNVVFEQEVQNDSKPPSLFDLYSVDPEIMKGMSERN